MAAACSGGSGGDDDGAAEGGGGQQVSDEQEGGADLRTTDTGLKIIEATDVETGLQLEIQDDSLYLKLPDEPSATVAGLGGDGLGGSCDVSDDAPFTMPRLFPVYWRDEIGDWGSAVTRGLPVPEDGGPTLAEHVVECRFYEAPPGSDEIRPRPENLVATIRVR